MDDKFTELSPDEADQRQRAGAAAVLAAIDRARKQYGAESALSGLFPEYNGLASVLYRVGCMHGKEGTEDTAKFLAHTVAGALLSAFYAGQDYAGDPLEWDIAAQVNGIVRGEDDA